MEIFPNRYRKICNKAKKVRQLPLLEAENFFFFTFVSSPKYIAAQF